MRIILLLLASAVLATAQTVPVVPIPYPQFVSYLQNGSPNAFGCVFTYAVNTNTPLATYTDGFSGTLNANPVVLSSGGTASIWLTVGSAYSITVKTNGGLNCASGSTVYTVNGLSGGSSTQTVVVPFSATPTFTDTSQNMLFSITLTGNATALPLSVVGVTPPGLITFQITQDSVGNHTFTWPSNIIGGAPIGLTANQVTTQEFVWNGTTATALAPAVTGSGPAISSGTISLTGLTSGDYLSSLNGTIIDSGARALPAAIKNTTVTTQTGDTALHTIYTIPIPGGAMSATGQMRITLSIKTNVVGGSPTIGILYGGTSIGGFPIAVNSGLGATNLYQEIIGGNIGATNSQSWEALAGFISGTVAPGNGYHSTSTVDSTVSQNLTVTFQGGANSDSITFYRIIVEFL